MARTGSFIQELEELLGEEGLFRLADAYGGFRMRIPINLTAECDMVQELGFEISRKLHERYSPDIISVPQCRELRAKVMFRQGHSSRSVGRALGLTRTGIEKMLAKRRKEDADWAFLKKDATDK